MDPYPLHTSPQTQELHCILLVTLCDSRQRLWDIIHAHLQLTQQMFMLALAFLPWTQKSSGATYHLPYGYQVPYFHLVDEAEAFLDSTDSKVL